ncbi:Cytochrome c biogenesis ATP-binding export protein CcmA [Moraxella cuniculi]|uniref:Cytochrome c biogenesis ATP-binding export protein CcmA n=2 Tax=Moraxella cuniculi TaxID=34061 RepID=A0A3S4SZ39_9GAMM|nr:Cytochrome c biogenesis ATP-binding export protein CcmA [Moraxella cuniculi]
MSIDVRMMGNADCTDSTHAQPIFTAQGVNVQRGEFLLCQGVDLALRAGDVCHLIGENGLGKTTLILQIAGLLPVMTGWITCKTGMVYVSHQLGISSALTVQQNLQFLLALHGVAADDELISMALEKVGLDGLQDVPAAQLSAGQMRRVGLAKLFVLTPAQAGFWLLDEPLTALDMQMVDLLERQIATFAAAGGAVLMTSHQAINVANCQLDLAEYAV